MLLFLSSRKYVTGFEIFTMGVIRIDILISDFHEH